MNQITITWLCVVAAVAMAAVGIKLAVDSRRPRGTDPQQIQGLITHGVEAADRRDAAAMGHLISSHYRDSLGMSDVSLRYQINDFFRRQSAIQVNLPPDRLKIDVQPGGKTATAQFHVAVSTQGTGGSTTTELDMTVQLAKEPVYYYWLFPGEEWRVTSAENYGALEGL